MKRTARMGTPASLLLVLAVTACGSPAPPSFPAPDTIPEIDPAQVESVVFFLGDAGEAYLSTSPTLAALQNDIEYWAEMAPRDSAVALLVLGDIRYPEGVRPADSPAYAADTAVVMSQVRTVSGGWATLRGARGYFMAGNHDWGQQEDFEGYVRLHNLDNLLGHARQSLGADVSLVPAAGTGGPAVVDFGEHLRLLMLDTAWWILDSTEQTRQNQLTEIENALETRGDREIIIAGHHPFRSSGSHGGQFSFWQTLGLRYVLNRSGAILEDLTSRPYRELEAGLRAVFARQEPPLMFAGGHDHSLQVLAAVEPTDPTISLVSGSGSKRSGVGTAEGLLYGEDLHGYMRLVVETDGEMTLFVQRVDADHGSDCPTMEPNRTQCMEAGVAAFRTAYWRKIR